ncbi:hypothetical protein [Pseudonocardia sp. NPDC046786]|uniref:hypothetical protein n=1 Tax=Pseudonocardia sp. NPDC046786 TaxID=3155471 RepID=UPI0033F0FF36
MIELLDGVYGFRPVGRISVADYEQVVVPVFDRADAERRRLRLLCVVDPGVHRAGTGRPVGGPAGRPAGDADDGRSRSAGRRPGCGPAEP